MAAAAAASHEPILRVTSRQGGPGKYRPFSTGPLPPGLYFPTIQFRRRSDEGREKSHNCARRPNQKWMSPAFCHRVGQGSREKMNESSWRPVVVGFSSAAKPTCADAGRQTRTEQCFGSAIRLPRSSSAQRTLKPPVREKAQRCSPLARTPTYLIPTTPPRIRSSVISGPTLHSRP